MAQARLGQIVILNGAPRAGKSSIAHVIQETFDGPWMNLGVDVFIRDITPERYRPGIGLRPGDDLPELRRLVPAMYRAMFESIAAHSRAGLNVAVDVGLYDPAIIAGVQRTLAGLPVLWVGVRCPIDEIMRRRNLGQPGREGTYATGTPGEPIPAPVQRWQDEVHAHMAYDLEVDSSRQSADECASAIRRRLER